MLSFLFQLQELAFLMVLLSRDPSNSSDWRSYIVLSDSFLSSPITFTGSHHPMGYYFSSFDRQDILDTSTNMYSPSGSCCTVQIPITRLIDEVRPLSVILQNIVKSSFFTFIKFLEWVRNQFKFCLADLLLPTVLHKTPGAIRTIFPNGFKPSLSVEKILLILSQNH